MFAEAKQRAKEKAEAAFREKIDETFGLSPDDAEEEVAAEEEEEDVAKDGDEGAPPTNDPEFDAAAEEAIPADVRMISGCHDTQTSADVSNVATFQLPDAAGKAGGALTSAILSIVYKEEEPSSEDLSFVDVFLQTREVVEEKGFTQIPQLSSSRCIDVSQPFDLMSNKFEGEGTRYAVLIGINYESHRQGRLRGCHNDVHNIKKYIMDVGMFEEDNMVTLMDDGNSTEPTRENIMEALDDLVQKCQPGDTAFVHYSGHGGRVKDETGQDPSGYNSTLCPVDYDKAGQILDKELYQYLVCAMQEGTALTCLMDCCHSGTVLDLPYNFVADGEQTEMTPTPDFPFFKLLALRNALKEAGVERFRDLMDPEKREAVKESMDNFELGKSLGRDARKSRREERRENRRGRRN